MYVYKSIYVYENMTAFSWKKTVTYLPTYRSACCSGESLVYVSFITKYRIYV